MARLLLYIGVIIYAVADTSMAACDLNKCENMTESVFNGTEPCGELTATIRCMQENFLDYLNCGGFERALVEIQVKLYKYLLDTFCTGKLPSDASSCDTDICYSKTPTIYDTDDACRALDSLTWCLDTIASNDSCSDSVKKKARQAMIGTWNINSELCDNPTASSDSDTCDIRACQIPEEPNMIPKERCWTQHRMISCVQKTLRSSSVCSENVKLELVVQLDDFINKYNDTCFEIPGVPVHGRCDIEKCWKSNSPSLEVKELCRLLPDSITCINTTLSNDTDCTDVHKLLGKMVTDEATIYVKQKCASCQILSSLALCLGLTVLTYFLVLVK